MKASKDMIVTEVLKLHDDAGMILMDAGLGCAGCPSAGFKTLEQAGIMHNIDIDAVIDKINALLEK